VKLPSGMKLFRVHHFNLMVKGDNFELEVDEYADGVFSGHAQHSTDKNFMIESTTGSSIEDCLNGLIHKIENRTK